MADSSDNKLVIVLTFVCCLIAVVSIILASVSMSKGSSDPSITLNVENGAAFSGGSSAGAGGGSSSEKIWTIAVTDQFGADSYMGDEGYVQGFSIDLITEVCEAAGIQCRTVWDTLTNCMQSNPGGHPTGGQGLLGGWYDGCAGWWGTVERVQIFDFSLPYTDSTSLHMYVKKEDNAFDVDNLTKYKIGFTSGTTADEQCLARAGYVMDDENVVHYDSRQASVQGLLDDEVEVIFGSTTYDEYIADGSIKFVEGLGGSIWNIKCHLSGSSIMTRKDSSLNSNWNRGFQKLRDNGRFKKLCAEGEKHENEHRKIRPCIHN